VNNDLRGLQVEDFNHLKLSVGSSRTAFTKPSAQKIVDDWRLRLQASLNEVYTSFVSVHP
jgi:hypothetical protein